MNRSNSNIRFALTAITVVQALAACAPRTSTTTRQIAKDTIAPATVGSSSLLQPYPVPAGKYGIAKWSPTIDLSRDLDFAQRFSYYGGGEPAANALSSVPYDLYVYLNEVPNLVSGSTSIQMTCDTPLALHQTLTLKYGVDFGGGALTADQAPAWASGAKYVVMLNGFYSRSKDAQSNEVRTPPPGGDYKCVVALDALTSASRTDSSKVPNPAYFAFSFHSDAPVVDPVQNANQTAAINWLVNTQSQIKGVYSMPYYGILGSICSAGAILNSTGECYKSNIYSSQYWRSSTLFWAIKGDPSVPANQFTVPAGADFNLQLHGGFINGIPSIDSNTKAPILNCGSGLVIAPSTWNNIGYGGSDPLFSANTNITRVKADFLIPAHAAGSYSCSLSFADLKASGSQVSPRAEFSSIEFTLIFK